MARHTFLYLALLLVGVVVCQEMYTTVYDNENVDLILSSERLRNQYLKCMLGEGRCDDKGKQLKETLPSAVSGKCDRCSMTQQQNARKIQRYMRIHHPADWARVKLMYRIPAYE